MSWLLVAQIIILLLVIALLTMAVVGGVLDKRFVIEMAKRSDHRSHRDAV